MMFKVPAEKARLTAQTKRKLVQGLMVAVEQRRVLWPAGSGGLRSAGETGSVADRGAQVARDTGPSAVLSRDGTDTYLANGRRENLGQDDRIYRIGGMGRGDWEVLTAEMRRYEYEIGPTGQVSYAAPSGYHDDCVMALALAVWCCRTYGVEPGRMLRLGD